jgi:hypothetical protein
MINNVAILFYLKKRTNSQKEKIRFVLGLPMMDSGQNWQSVKIQPKLWKIFHFE